MEGLTIEEKARCYDERLARAKELMIGDWVQIVEPCKYAGAIGRIKTLIDHKDEENAYFKVFLQNNTIHIGIEDICSEDIRPIPLTPEILEKNGWKHEFDKTDYMVKYDLGKEGKDCWMMWAIKEHNLDIQRQDKKLDVYNLKVSKVVIPCDYVHELQHALGLCGIEKEIKL